MARPRSITDEQIRRAAREVFLEHGPSAPVSRVAQRLGVSHAALFQRAGSKEQLMLQALEPGRPPGLERLLAPPQADVPGALVAILGDLMGFLHQLVPSLVVLRAAGHSVEDLPGAAEGPPPPVLLRQALTRWLEATDLELGSPRAIAEGLLGAMEARCFNAYLGDQDFTPESDEAFLEAMVTGLVGPIQHS